MMSNYRIMYDGDTRDGVIEVVKDFSNDIMIDKVEDDGVMITIESDEAEEIYNRLLDEIGRRVYARR